LVIGPCRVHGGSGAPDIYAWGRFQAVDADCVLYNPPTERYSEIIPILASGKNVISIIAGWNPKKRNCYQAVLDACETGQSSL